MVAGEQQKLFKEDDKLAFKEVVERDIIEQVERYLFLGRKLTNDTQETLRLGFVNRSEKVIEISKMIQRGKIGSRR